jgi:response regulator of citrate/malate metabolism
LETTIDVIIMEDDPMVQELHRQYVSKVKGYKLVGVAQNGEEGLQMINTLNPQLAIVDIYMPILNGLEVLRQSRKLGLNIDIILVTAAHDSEVIQQGIQYGAVDYIIKPFTFQRLRKALTSYSNYYSKIGTKAQLSQQEIDMLKANATANKQEISLPKGLQRTTLGVIVNLIKKKTAYFTANEISEETGISLVTVRKYLNFLYKSGWLKETLSYGTVGRPLQRFMLAGGK